MDNSQFRNLLQNEASQARPKVVGASKSAMLGSRARSSIPMTPRAVAGHNASKDFARQVSEHNRQADGQPAVKKFKSIAAPRGTKIARGYEDRTTLRRQDEEQLTDKEKKLKELEEMVKNDKIDQATFEKLRDQMGVGGDLGTTHLVKGLDKRLLERVRRGEDLNANLSEEVEPTSNSVDVDDELDSALDRDIAPTEQEASQPTEEGGPSVPQTLTRNEILQRLKASRNATMEARVAPTLNGKFKKLPAADKPGRKKYVESVDGRRREVLIITGKDGSTKRKSRWIDPETSANDPSAAAPMGMEIPAEMMTKRKLLDEQEAAEDEDDDIFQGVGKDYDPLKGIESDSEDDKEKPAPPNEIEPGDRSEPKPRNYFGESSMSENNDKSNPLTSDSTILAALKRAAALRQGEAKDKESADENQSEKQKEILARFKQEERQDAADMDLGFGESRFGDEDDEDGPVWDDEPDPAATKRKRAPKKRKGDKDSVADVMSVLDGRKKS